MKLYQKILAVSTLLLFIGFTVLWFVEFSGELIFSVFLSMTGTTVVLLMTLKNERIYKAFLYSIPVTFLIYIVLGGLIESEQVMIYLIIIIGYVLITNNIINYKRFDIIFILVTCLIIFGFLLRHWHYPGGALLFTISALTLFCYSIVFIVKAFRIKESRYLSFVIMACSIILAGLSAAFLLKIQHLPGRGILITVFIPAYILATLIILLTLPGSNFTEWSGQQRKILTRGLLIPWLFFMYLLVTSALIPPYNVLKPFFFLEGKSSKEVHFDMKDYKPEEKNGLVNEE